MSSFTDLNIPIQDSNTNKEILLSLADYGYECVAFNHEVKLAKKVQYNESSHLLPPLQQKFMTEEECRTSICITVWKIKKAPDIHSLVDRPLIPKGCRRAMQVLQRLTVTVEDPSVLHILSSSPLDSYDVLAICPGTDKVLQQACSVLNVDIISMKLDERLPYKLKHAQIGQAVGRGIYFEICYSPAIKDATARRNVLANAMELVDVSRRKNIIVSSQAVKALDVRGPADVINLCHLFGLTGGMCKSTITSHCRAVLLHSAMRRKTAKGVVACELISEEPALDESMDDSVISSTPADIDLAEIPIATADAPDITAESPSQAAGPSSKKKPRRKRGRRSRSGSKSAKRTKH